MSGSIRKVGKLPKPNKDAEILSATKKAKPIEGETKILDQRVKAAPVKIEEKSQEDTVHVGSYTRSRPKGNS